MPRPIVPFVGRLTADPVVSTLKNGNQMAKFTIAINIESGPNKDTANFYDIACFDKLAENAPKFLFKGSLVVCHALMEVVPYTDKNGNNAKANNYTAISINSIPVSKKPDGASDAHDEAPEETVPVAADDTDDIPF